MLKHIKLKVGIYSFTYSDLFQFVKDFHNRRRDIDPWQHSHTLGQKNQGIFYLGAKLQIELPITRNQHC